MVRPRGPRGSRLVAPATVHPFRVGLLAGAGALVAYLGYRALAEIPSILVIYSPPPWWP